MKSDFFFWRGHLGKPIKVFFQMNQHWNYIQYTEILKILFYYIEREIKSIKLKKNLTCDGSLDLSAILQFNCHCLMRQFHQKSAEIKNWKLGPYKNLLNFNTPTLVFNGHKTKVTILGGSTHLTHFWFCMKLIWYCDT